MHIKNTLWALIFVVSCKTPQTLTCDLFSSWRDSNLIMHDSLVEANKEEVASGLYSPEATRKDLTNTDLKQLEAAFKKALKKHKINDWEHVYVIYNYLEGNPNLSLYSFVFCSRTKARGITYDYSWDQYYKMRPIKEEEIAKVKTTVSLGSNTFLTLYKMDRNCKILSKEMLLGVFPAEFQPLMDLYNPSMW